MSLAETVGSSYVTCKYKQDVLTILNMSIMLLNQNKYMYMVIINLEVPESMFLAITIILGLSMGAIKTQCLD